MSPGDGGDGASEMDSEDFEMEEVEEMSEDLVDEREDNNYSNTTTTTTKTITPNNNSDNVNVTRDDGIPEEFRCPISGELLVDPVVASDGVYLLLVTTWCLFVVLVNVDVCWC